MEQSMERNWVQKILIIYIILVLGFLLFGELLLPKDNLGADDGIAEYEGEWYLLSEDGSLLPQEVPGECDVARGERITLKTTLPDRIAENTYLCFRSGKQDMEFYIDDELRQIYDTKKTRVTGKVSAVAYIFVELTPEDAGKTLTYTFQSDSPYSGITYPIYQGSQMGIWMHYFDLYGAEVILALVVIMLSGIVIIASAILRTLYQRQIDLEYLGWGGLFAGIWIVSDSVFRQLLFPNMSVISDMAFYMVMLIPIPYLLYVNQLQKGRYQKVYSVMEWVAVGDVAVCSLLHITKLVDFADSFVCMAGVCIATILVLAVTMGMDAIRGYVKEYKIVFWGLILAFVSGIVQIVTYFEKTRIFNGVILTLGLIILTIVATSNSVIDLLRTEREKQKRLIASKSRSDFLANMSHELRTPINVVLGLDTMILHESTEPQIQKYALDIENAGQTLLAIINDILDLTKIESGKMEIVPLEYDFSSLIHDVFRMTAMMATQKGLGMDLKIDDFLPSGLYGDDVRIRQILLNLLNNAVKYTKKGLVTLEVHGEVQEDEVLLHFSVKDTGIGIRQEDMVKLFTPFERIHEKSNRGIEGTGLGISITVELLNLMDSKLSVDSVYGEGSNFSFDLRQKITNPEPIGDLRTRIVAGLEDKDGEEVFVAPDARILVVDDTLMNLKIFVHLLKETQVQIDQASSGTEALKLSSGQKYDIIFLDYMMPDMNGIEVLQTMRSQDDNPNKATVAIALTANAVTGAREMYLNAGFEDFLPKPIDAKKLVKLIREYLPKDMWSYPAVQPKQAAEASDQKEENSAEQRQPELSLPEVEGIDWDYALLKLKDRSFVHSVAEDYMMMADSDLSELKKLWENLKQAANVKGLEIIEEKMGTHEESDPDVIPAKKDGDDSLEEDFRQYRIKAHAMKTSAAMIGAAGVSSLARLLEYAARDGKLSRIEELMPLFEEEWELLEEHMVEAFSEQEGSVYGAGSDDTSKEAKPPIDRSRLKQYLDDLNAAMDDMDVDTADAIMEELQQFSYEEEEEEAIQDLKIAVRNLDQDRVLEISNYKVWRI